MRAPASSARIGLAEGDGIGPEIVSAAVAVLEAAAARTGARPLELVSVPIGFTAIDAFGTPLPEHVLDELAGTDGWIMGPVDGAAYHERFRRKLNPSGTVRRHFDLYANVRPARLLGGPSRHADECDLVIVRENTQGFYADRNTFLGTGEWMPAPDVAIAQSVFTRPAIERVARVACGVAMARHGHLTVVHKANVLSVTTGLFRDVCYEVAVEFPSLRVDDLHVDAAAALLLRRPSDFDVLVTENMFGDILSDLTAEICGSLGIAGSLNLGDQHAMAQAAHGAAPDIAGTDTANPTGMILSASQLARWLGDRRGDDRLLEAADRIDAAVANTIRAGSATRDLGGSLGTRAFATAVCDKVAAS